MAKISYSEAKKELKAIVKSIEDGEMDVDLLTAKVKRASELLALCKEKLKTTDEELQKILEDMA